MAGRSLPSVDIAAIRERLRGQRLRVVLALLVLALLVPVGVSALTHEPTSLGPGTIESPAENRTIVAIQGFHFQGQGSEKKPARLLAAGPRGQTKWIFDGSERGANWFYDVDPLENGNLLVTSTVPGDTVIHEYDPDTKEFVWSQEFDAADTHDADLINGDELIVANMRNYDAEREVSNDRIFIYNLTRDEIVWEWRIRNHSRYGPDTAGGYREDWSHVNDVDKIADGRYLVSPRNFDQVIVVDRETKAIVQRLGSDGNHSRLYEQHNPDYLRGPNGEPTMLVADSENDRVVEYARRNGSWELVWSVSGGFNWPRDADRLPNGNTLITDSLNHRVVEVTPQGEIVWEYFATWAPYDTERLGTGDGSNGPTMREQGVSGEKTLSGGSGRGPTDRVSVAAWVETTTAGTPIAGQASWLAQRYAHIAPFVRPVWLSNVGFVSGIGALLLALVWGGGEIVARRRRVAAAVRGVVG
jgi:hypothetical protein